LPGEGVVLTRWIAEMTLEGMGTASSAIEMYRRMVDSNLAVRLPDVACELSDLGVELGRLRRYDEALAAGTEAVRVFRRLAETDPVGCEAGLAAALDNRGIALATLGRLDEALADCTQAVATFRRLTAANAAHIVELATALNNLGNRQRSLGHSAAVATMEEAVEVCRRLAEGDRAHQGQLALALNNLGAALSNQARAAEVLIESVEIYRRLAGECPGKFDQDFGRALTNLGREHWDAGRRDEAIVTLFEAVDVRRSVARSNRMLIPDLARTLINLGAMLSYVDRRREAVAAAEEAMRLYEENSADQPPPFADELNAARRTFADIVRADTG
jgi:tetratricopeptide (TPR) repeat protein